jgi:hypothetical protein
LPRRQMGRTGQSGGRGEAHGLTFADHHFLPAGRSCASLLNHIVSHTMTDDRWASGTPE